MKTLVCGGRRFADRRQVFERLDILHLIEPITCVVEGGATGADRFAREWAEAHGIKVRTYEPDWRRWGRGAGPRRNSLMLVDERPDLVVAFAGGNGTADMCSKAAKFGVRVLRIHPAGSPMPDYSWT